jgi:succinate dehydrogenase / fumarate reductase cytochrome b subunit
MAVSGLIFYGWLCLHMVGNMAVFAGHEAMNKYAHLLQSNKELLWAMRIGLLAVVVTHIATAIRLSRKNRAARPEAYQSARNWRQASLASRTMLVSGLVALAFLVFHLAHFTGGMIQSQFYAGNTQWDGLPDVYGMVTGSFRNPVIALVYVVSVGTIGMHLSHAVWSATHTLGLTGPKWTPWAKSAGWILGVGVAALMCLIPLAAVTRILPDSPRLSADSKAQANGAGQHSADRGETK